MSGPIVRKYGFPNHDQIFGKQPPKHGVDAPEETRKAEEPGVGAGAAEAKDEPKAEKK